LKKRKKMRQPIQYRNQQIKNELPVSAPPLRVGTERANKDNEPTGPVLLTQDEADNDTPLVKTPNNAQNNIPKPVATTYNKQIGPAAQNKKERDNRAKQKAKKNIR